MILDEVPQIVESYLIVIRDKDDEIFALHAQQKKLAQENASLKRALAEYLITLDSMKPSLQNLEHDRAHLVVEVEALRAQLVEKDRTIHEIAQVSRLYPSHQEKVNSCAAESCFLPVSVVDGGAPYLVRHIDRLMSENDNWQLQCQVSLFQSRVFQESLVTTERDMRDSMTMLLSSVHSNMLELCNKLLVRVEAHNFDSRTLHCTLAQLNPRTVQGSFHGTLAQQAAAELCRLNDAIVAQTLAADTIVSQNAFITKQLSNEQCRRDGEFAAVVHYALQQKESMSKALFETRGSLFDTSRVLWRTWSCKNTAEAAQIQKVNELHLQLKNIKFASKSQRLEEGRKHLQQSESTEKSLVEGKDQIIQLRLRLSEALQRETTLKQLLHNQRSEIGSSLCALQLQVQGLVESLKSSVAEKEAVNELCEKANRKCWMLEKKCTSLSQSVDLLPELRNRIELLNYEIGTLHAAVRQHSERSQVSELHVLHEEQRRLKDVEVHKKCEAEHESTMAQLLMERTALIQSKTQLLEEKTSLDMRWNHQKEQLELESELMRALHTKESEQSKRLLSLLESTRKKLTALETDNVELRAECDISVKENILLKERWSRCTDDRGNGC